MVTYSFCTINMRLICNVFLQLFIEICTSNSNLSIFKVAKKPTLRIKAEIVTLENIFLRTSL